MIFSTFTSESVQIRRSFRSSSSVLLIFPDTVWILIDACSALVAFRQELKTVLFRECFPVD